MKILFTNKNKGIDNNVKILEINSSEINTSEEVFALNKNEIPVIKYSDTEELFLIKDASNKFIDNKGESLFIILNSDLIALGGSGSATPVDSRPYKVYTALLTQTGTDEPVATVLENTLGTVVWNRVGVGSYQAKLTGAFTENKTFILMGSNINMYNVDSATFNINKLSIDSFTLDTFDTNIQAFDEVLLNTSIEIRVYN